ncbi:MAG: 50S ribosomal protein L24 [Candidatus Bathyarchaeia archaeon]
MKTTRPRKQRKKLYQAPLHKRYRRFSASLSPDLKSSHNTNSIPVRTGDTVRVMRGDYKGFEGKVTSVDRKEYRIFVEGATREKVDGSTAFIPIHPSKVMITRLNLDDKWRREILKRKGGVAEKAKLTEEEIVEEAEPPKKKRKRRKRAQKKAAESGGT